MKLQSIQTARLFLQSSELGHPHPLTRRRVCSPHLIQGGTHPLAGQGVGGSQFRRVDRHCSTLGIYVLCEWNCPKNAPNRRERTTCEFIICPERNWRQVEYAKYSWLRFLFNPPADVLWRGLVWPFTKTFHFALTQKFIFAKVGKNNQRFCGNVC